MVDSCWVNGGPVVDSFWIRCGFVVIRCGCVVDVCPMRLVLMMLLCWQSSSVALAMMFLAVNEPTCGIRASGLLSLSSKTVSRVLLFICGDDCHRTVASCARRFVHTRAVLCPCVSFCPALGRWQARAHSRRRTVGSRAGSLFGAS